MKAKVEEKRKSKKITRTRKVSLYHIAEYESYLQQMATQGWYLLKMNSISDVFEKREAGKQIYRIEHVGKKKREEVCALYKEHHFSLCASRGKFLVFSYQGEDLAQDEIRKTAQDNQEFWMQFSGRNLRNIILLFFCAVCLLGAMVCSVFLGGHIATKLLEGMISYISMVVIAGYLILCGIRQIQYRKKQKQRVAEQKKFVHEADWKPQEKIFDQVIILTVILLLINGVTAVYSFKYAGDLYRGKAEYSLHEKTAIPVKSVRLNTIEEMKNPRLMGKSKKGKLNKYNYAMDHTNLLYKECVIMENLYEMQEQSGKKNIQFCYLSTHYYKIRVPFLADGVFDELCEEMNTYYKTFGKAKTTKIKGTQFDRAVRITVNKIPETAVVVRKGNVIASYRYSGVKKPKEILDKIYKALK